MGKGEFFEDSFAWSAKAAATVLKVRCESGWCRGYDFDIKLLVTSREVHKPEITKSKEEKKLFQTELDIVSKELTDLKKENSTMAGELEGFTKQIEFFGECTYQSSKTTVDLKVWKKISPLYKWAQSPDGIAVVRDSGQAKTLIEKFCGAYDLLDRYHDV